MAGVSTERPPRPGPGPPTADSGPHCERLRHLAVADASPTRRSRTAWGGPNGLDARTAAVAHVAALVALRAPPPSYRHAVERALAAGASPDDLVDTLKVVAGAVGLARVVSAAPRLSLALGYDIDDALETLDDPRRPGDRRQAHTVGDGTGSRRADGC
jgi:4-carboxymuconolactone decarboxylase